MADFKFNIAKRFEKKAPATGKRQLPGSEFESSFYHAGPGDQTDFLANQKGQFIEIYHLPSQKSVAFKAAVSNFQDSYSQTWTPTEVFGRMDPIYTYQRTTRNITIGIDVMAASFMEAEVNFGRISLLEQMQYPLMDGNLEDGSAHIKGVPLVKVKLLNWISKGEGGSASQQGLLGHIDGITFSPKLDLGTFQDGLNLYPKGFEISFNLKVIHEENLGWTYGDNQEVTPINTKYPYGTAGVDQVQSNPFTLDAADFIEGAFETQALPPETEEAEGQKILNAIANASVGTIT